MANQVEKVAGIAIASIEKISSRTDANIQNISGREFRSLVRYTQSEDLTHSAEQTSPYDTSSGRGYFNVLAWLYREGTTDRVLSAWFAYGASPSSSSRLTCIQYNGTSAPARTEQSVINADNPGWWHVGVDTDTNTENQGVCIYTAGDVASDPTYVARVLVDDSDDEITFGTPVAVTAGRSHGYVAHDKNTAGAFLAIVYDTTDSDSIILRAGTTSGSTITLGTALDSSRSGDWPTIEADPNNAGRYAVGWKDDADGKAYAAIATVSGTSITLGTPLAVSSGAAMNEDPEWIKWDKTRANILHIAYVDSANSSYPTQIGASVAAGPTGTAITLSSTGAEVAESEACEGVNITSDYFINNPHVDANQGAGFLMRSKGGANDSTGVFAWTCDEDQDYTIGNSSELTGTSSVARNGMAASPYTAGIHMLAYQDDLNAAGGYSEAYYARMKAVKLGGQWDA